MSGIFISLEGIDGAGKTTQAERLAEALRARGHRVVSVREPGSTALAERVRAILLDPEQTDITPRAELLLYLACRAQLVERVIRPALAEGAVVISDRYADSTVAYQGYGRGLGAEFVRQANLVATDGLMPDVTFVVDAPVEVALARRAGGRPDRLEAQARAFHERVRQGFLEIARREPARVIVVDGARAPDRIAEHIFQQLTARFPALGRSIDDT